MPHSASPTPDGIILDTNVLSLLASANQLDLLQQLAASPLYITPAIQKELLAGLEKGVHEIQEALNWVNTRQIQVLKLETAEDAMMAGFPNQLALGECEAIAICSQRNMMFITRDRKAANYCDRTGVSCIRLKVLLSQFQKAGLLTQTEIEQILT
ncbi:PIN domain-containing protein [Chloroflexi bacterium TSY]|nr:PIN domain-containing protein [Chloroflexi bacterium TSY]